MNLVIGIAGCPEFTLDAMGRLESLAYEVGARSMGPNPGATRATRRGLNTLFGGRVRVWHHHAGGAWDIPPYHHLMSLDGRIVVAIERGPYATTFLDLSQAQGNWEAHRALVRDAGRARYHRSNHIVEAIARGDGGSVAIGRRTLTGEVPGFDGDVTVTVDGYERFGALVAPARGTSIIRALEARGSVTLSQKEREILANPKDWRREDTIIGILYRAIAEGKALRAPAPSLPARQRRAGNLEWEMCAY